MHISINCRKKGKKGSHIELDHELWLCPYFRTTLKGKFQDIVIDHCQQLLGREENRAFN